MCGLAAIGGKDDRVDKNAEKGIEPKETSGQPGAADFRQLTRQEETVAPTWRVVVI